MDFTRYRLRWSAWMAALALLVAALAPGVSQALGTAPSWLEVCTASGSRWMSADADMPEVPASGGEQGADLCPFCSLHLPLAGLPPAALALARKVETVAQAPIAPRERPAGAPQRRAAPARAPPAAG